jgi:hypothetical protein
MTNEKMQFIVRRKDINEAVTRGREDERITCEKEKQRALEDLRKQIEGDYYLKMVDLQGKANSLEIRNARLEKEIKLYKDRDNEVKEIHLQQKQITSDLNYFVGRWQQEKTEELQEFLRIGQRIENIDCKAMKKQITDGGK